MNDVHVTSPLWVSFLICKVKVLYYKMISESLFLFSHDMIVRLWSWIFFCHLVFMGCWGIGYIYCYKLGSVCLEDLRGLGITRRITDVWLFHWKILLAMKPTLEWKYTRSGHCFSPSRDNHYFQSHRDFTNAPTTLFLPAVTDFLIPGMIWGAHDPVCFKSRLMFVTLISARLSLPKESFSDSGLDHVICLRGIFPFS